MAFNVGLISQPTLIFLFLNVLAALLLHASRLPIWLTLFSLSALAWRLFMFSGHLPKPNWLAKLVLVTIGFSGIYMSYGASLTIESAVSLLIAGVMLKPLEVEKQQHSYLLIFLNYFLCALLFLFDRTPMDFLLVLLVMMFTLASQVLVHFYDQPNRMASVKLGAGLLLKSLPLALVLFFVLPRLGPLWTLNVPTQSGVVGLSSSMSPGSIAALGENNDIAFRVKLSGEDVPMNQRYWRAFTLSDYDGKEWKQGYSYQSKKDYAFYDPAEEFINYEVMVEPHEKKWLFALGAVNPLSNDIEIQDDATIESKKKVYSQLRYQAQSNLSALLPQTYLSKSEWHRYTSLPKGSNPQSQLFAQQLYERSGGLSQFIEQLRTYISTQNFKYTLSPGVFDGDEQIDDFLFESKSGFCSYYAGSVTFLLRSAGVPARVVLGYMGGEENPLSDTLSIYQHDAHAWVEVFLDGQGWLRIDPTAWVAPERVESGLQQAIPNEFKGFNSQSVWLKELRKRWQAFDYFWNDWMLSYKGEKQQALLQDFWGERSVSELIILLVSIFLILGLGLFGFLWWDQAQKPVTYEQKIYTALHDWLMSHQADTQARSKSGQTKEQGLTLFQILAQLSVQYPKLEPSLKALNKRLEAALYGPGSQSLDKKTSRELMSLIKILKKQA